MSEPFTLVTGATGLVGNNVVRLLSARRERVRVLVRKGSDPRPIAGLAVEVAEGDVTDPDSVARAADGVSHVVHAAALVRIGWTGLEEFRRVNVEGTRNVVDAARRAGARLVHVSTTDTIGLGTPEQPATEDAQGGFERVPYVLSKREAEQAVLAEAAKELHATVVNPAYMLGPWDWKPSSGAMLLEVARGKGLLAPRGWFSLCDVRDVAAGIVAARDRGKSGRRYILAGHNIRYADAWRLFAEITGGRRPLMRAGPMMLVVGGAAGDLWGRVTGREPLINSAAIRLASQAKVFSSERAQRELGYTNRPVRETVVDAWDWLRVHHLQGGAA